MLNLTISTKKVKTASDNTMYSFHKLMNAKVASSKRGMWINFKSTWGSAS